MQFIEGSELSVTWRDHTVHIVALGIDPENSPLANGLETVRSGRDARARRIAQSLAACGHSGCAARARSRMSRASG